MLDPDPEFFSSLDPDLRVGKTGFTQIQYVHYQFREEEKTVDNIYFETINFFNLEEINIYFINSAQFYY